MRRRDMLALWAGKRTITARRDMETDFTAVDIGNNFYRVNANTQRARDWAGAQGYDDDNEDQPGGRQAARASPYSIIVTNDDIDELIEEVCDAGYTVERQEKSTLTPKGVVGALGVIRSACVQ